MSGEMVIDAEAVKKFRKPIPTAPASPIRTPFSMPPLRVFAENDFTAMRNIPASTMAMRKICTDERVSFRNMIPSRTVMGSSTPKDDVYHRELALLERLEIQDGGNESEKAYESQENQVAGGIEQVKFGDDEWQQPDCADYSNEGERLHIPELPRGALYQEVAHAPA